MGAVVCPFSWPSPLRARGRPYTHDGGRREPWLGEPRTTGDAAQAWVTAWDKKKWKSSDYLIPHRVWVMR